MYLESLIYESTRRGVHGILELLALKELITIVRNGILIQELFDLAIRTSIGKVLSAKV